MPSIVDERGFNQGFKLTPAQLFRLSRRAQAIVSALPANLNRPRILELGCGTGELAHELATLVGGEVTGVDLSEKFVEEARKNFKRSNLKFQVLDLTKDRPARVYDGYHAIVGNGILHHLYHHLDSTLEALRAWLLPGGWLIFWEPNLFNPYVWSIFTLPRLRQLARLEPDEMAFTPGFIHSKLASANFRNIHVATRDFLLPITPQPFIKINAFASDIIDQVPLVNRLAQSIFLIAQK